MNDTSFEAMEQLAIADAKQNEKGDEQFQAIASFSVNLEAAAVKKTMQAVGAKSADLWQVPVDELCPLPNFNMRLDSAKSAAHIDRLFQSIMANGFYKDKPLTGFVAVDPEDSSKTIIYYTDGHHRMAAVKKAIANGKKIEVLPIMIKDKDTSIKDLTISSFHSNNLQEPYTTLETALLCLRLRQSVPPMETFQIAEALNFRKSYVETLLILARSPKEIRDMVQEGKVSASQAIDLLKKKKEQAASILTKAVAEAEKKAAAAAAQKAKAAAPAPAPAEPKTSPELTEALTALGPKPPVTGTTTATAPASKVEAEKVKPVKVTRADLNPMAKLEEAQIRLAPRLFAEVIRMEKAGEIKIISPELEKILFTIDAVTPKPEA